MQKKIGSFLIHQSKLLGKQEQVLGLEMLGQLVLPKILWLVYGLAMQMVKVEQV